MRTSVWTSLALVSPGILYGIMPANVMMDLAISLLQSIDAAVVFEYGYTQYVLIGTKSKFWGHV